MVENGDSWGKVVNQLCGVCPATIKEVALWLRAIISSLKSSDAPSLRPGSPSHRFSRFLPPVHTTVHRGSGRPTVCTGRAAVSQPVAPQQPQSGMAAYVYDPRQGWVLVNQPAQPMPSALSTGYQQSGQPSSPCRPASLTSRCRPAGRPNHHWRADVPAGKHRTSPAAASSNWPSATIMLPARMRNRQRQNGVACEIPLPARARRVWHADRNVASTCSRRRSFVA